MLIAGKEGIVSTSIDYGYAVPPGDPPFTIRDHFAGLAMQGYVASGQGPEIADELKEEGMDGADAITESLRLMTRLAYVTADEMLKARKDVQP